MKLTLTIQRNLQGLSFGQIMTGCFFGVENSFDFLSTVRALPLLAWFSESCSDFSWLSFVAFLSLVEFFLAHWVLLTDLEEHNFNIVYLWNTCSHSRTHRNIPLVAWLSEFIYPPGWLLSCGSVGLVFDSLWIRLKLFVMISTIHICFRLYSFKNFLEMVTFWILITIL